MKGKPLQIPLSASSEADHPAAADVVCQGQTTSTKEKRQAFTCLFSLVRETGLEPVRHMTHAPQTCLSAGSSTLAYSAPVRRKGYYSIPVPRCQPRGRQNISSAVRTAVLVLRRFLYRVCGGIARGSCRKMSPYVKCINLTGRR